ncbi:MAG: nitronate monooxygenase [Gammaproteobacteria bacterium]|nr:nitronate monooxygenase [Gammaproteobacteria bacterium]
MTSPVICGAMYPCSNPELVAAVSEAGGIGIVQPVSLTYVHGYDFRDGLRYIRTLTDKPVGMNALIEQSSRHYHRRMQEWVDIALEEDIRFFVTSLGKPSWVVERVHAAGGYVYHDTTNRKFAGKAIEAGVDGLICVNNRAGGHTGQKGTAELYNELADLNLPLVCAGGISTAEDYRQALQLGYEGVQMGTAFIATTECSASQAYKQAIINAQENDIILSERITGVPVSVINTPIIQRMGTRAGPLARWLLKGTRSKYLMRNLYALRSVIKLKKSLHDQTGKRDIWQAGKSVAGVDSIKPAAEIIRQLTMET